LSYTQFSRIKYYNPVYYGCPESNLIKGVSINSLKQKVTHDNPEEKINELLDVLELLLEERALEDQALEGQALEGQAEGFSEHQLLTLLQEPPHAFFAADAMRDPLVLFQTHFLLFHCLYLLRNRWQKNRYASLEITALSIKKIAITSLISTVDSATSSHGQTDQLLLNADPLAQYYLDWSHFSNTSSEDVNSLLDSFWKKVYQPQSAEDLQHALKIMELEAPLPLPQLKQQYRRLAQRFHPDKGGESEHFKKICQAFHQLRQSLN
jgi:hypothetical protein